MKLFILAIIIFISATSVLALPANSDDYGNVTLKAKFYGCNYVNRPVVKAICSHDFIEVKKLIDNGISPDETFTFMGCGAEECIDILTLATVLQFNDIATYLLEKGANPKRSIVFQNTPLHAAVISGNIEMVSKFLELGGDMYAEESYYNLSSLAWIAASDEMKIEKKKEILKIFLKKNANLNQASNDGRTILEMAVSQPDDEVELTEILLDNNANPNRKSNSGWTPLLRAALFYKLSHFKALLKHGAEINISKDGKFTALCGPTSVMGFWTEEERAYTNDFYHTIISAGFKLLDTPCDSGGTTPLMNLVNNGVSLNLIRDLISHGANLNALDSRGLTAIMYPFFFQSNYSQGRVNAAKIIIDAGADLNIRSDAMSALMLASDSYSYAEYGEYLVDAGAYLDFVNDQGKSALLLCLFQESTSALRKLAIKLIRAGANLEFQSTSLFQYTAIHLAAMDSSSEVLREIILRGDNVNRQTPYDSTPLMLAAKHDNLENVKLLIENGALVNIRDVYKKTALFYAESESIKRIIQTAGGIM
ncbi:MAG: hypothetical protein A2381_09605 [Bdellovibrionales bacterium RIFOXYB1_FULL_37_110]|nr:MAG: hypothetical protein A2417_02890 [Bdellovibrionales bacterium RIFOXYC1_FULL_37_79]OFZ59518.1 MAG: hypothetical protein A2381_09605 [Bdellovibrionales bacterium RIFOXYB1_FULL_37_110]OFZ64237.1 MAG: hypothetical protein A2577_12455 [Bdellovibrionales bacterium RIFOXYD1_FULL_36_51]